MGSEIEVFYAVIFKGKLIPGFEKAQVVAKLSHLTQMSPAETEKRFFQNKVVLVKRTADLEKAKRYHAKFLKAGAAVEIQMEFDGESI